MRRLDRFIALLATLALSVTVSIADARAQTAPVRTAEYVAMRDGVRLAVSLYRPSMQSGPYPAVLIMSVYGREQRLSEGARTSLLNNGVAVVFADMRGSGASFGRRRMVFSAEERSDVAEILDWIRVQSWSDGRVIVTGASYDANLAELAVVSGSEAVVAAVPRFEDFNTYRDLAAPGGVRNEMLLREWGNLTRRLETNEACLLRAQECLSGGAAPVDGDQDFQVLRAALLEHQANWNAAIDARAFAFEDDVATSGQRNAAGYLSSFLPAWGESRVPAQIWGSWLDARTADSALARYEASPHAAVEVVIGAWAHGGGANLDPLLARPLQGDVQVGPEILAYVADTLSGAQSRTRRIRYYTMGAGVWRESAVWPPSGINSSRWSLASPRSLSVGGATAPAAVDTYRVDYAATTGAANRWHTQLGGQAVNYGNRNSADRRLLTYTSAPLEQPLEITGAPVAHLDLNASRPDGAVFVYLEAVSPDGRVVYITEGQRRIGFRGDGFGYADFSPPFPGEWFNLNISLATTSVVVERGWSIRLAIAGADSDTFARYPSEGDLSYSIRTGADGSWLELPQAIWRPAQ